MKNSKLETYLPNWIKTCRDTHHFWGFIKPKYSTYAERREFIRNEFSSILNFLGSSAIYGGVVHMKKILFIMIIWNFLNYIKKTFQIKLNYKYQNNKNMERATK